MYLICGKHWRTCSKSTYASMCNVTEVIVVLRQCVPSSAWWAWSLHSDGPAQRSSIGEDWWKHRLGGKRNINDKNIHVLFVTPAHTTHFIAYIVNVHIQIWIRIQGVTAVPFSNKGKGSKSDCTADKGPLSQPHVSLVYIMLSSYDLYIDK